MGRLIKWTFIGAFVGLVCWHFWPAQTKHTTERAWDKTYRAARELSK